MRVKSIVTAAIAGWAMAAVTTVPGLAAQTPIHQHPVTATAQPAPGMETKCQAMMAGQEKMMTEVKAADQRRDELVATMNAASSSEKLAATSAVVAELVAQRRTMRNGAMTMQQDMMGHMMAHMQAGTDSMASCPMMKQMGTAKP